LIHGLFEFWEERAWFQKIYQTSIDHLGDAFDDCDVLREVVNCVDVNIDSFFLGLVPELILCILLFIVRDKLGGVLPVCLWVQNREVDLRIRARAWIVLKVAEANRWHQQGLGVRSELDLTILLEEVVNKVAKRLHFTSLLLLGQALDQKNQTVLEAIFPG